MGWQTFGKLEVKNDGPFEYNPHYVRLSPPVIPINGQAWKMKVISVSV